MSPDSPAPPRPFQRALLIAVGWIALALAIAGVALPLVPTTPFVLLAAACFARSSPRLHRALLEHPRLGPYLRQWKHDRSVPPGAKKRAYLVVVVTFGVSIALVEATGLRVLLAVLGCALLAFLARLRTGASPPPETLAAAPESSGDELFERAVDAVVAGELLRLQALLEREPELVRRRSARPHHATLLHYVAANGVEDERQKPMPLAPACARLLIAAGAEADALCETYGGGPAQTTLALAASSLWPEKAGVMHELIRALIEGGADPDGVEHDGVPMASAIVLRRPPAVAELARHARLDNVLFAAAAGRLDLVERELDERGRLRPGAGHCPVPWLKMSTDPEIAPQQALARAAQFGHLEVVRFLAERAVSVNLSPVHGAPAIHEASFAGHVELVEHLLAHGADPGVRDAQFQATAIGWATEGKHDDVVAAILRRFQPDVFDACELGLLDRVRALVDADPALANAPEGKGAPLRIASARGHLALVELLLARGADPSLRNEQGASALDLARGQRHADVVALLERHAPPRAALG